MTNLRQGATLVLVGLSVAAIAAPIAAAQVEVGLRTPPWRYPAAVVSYAASPAYRLEVSLMHRPSAIQRLSQVGVYGVRVFEPVTRNSLHLQPWLGIGMQVGSMTVQIRGARSTTPTVSLQLLGGAEHQLPALPITVFAQAWHGLVLQPVGLGWGAALGFRIPLDAMFQGPPHQEADYAP